jgi:hypothetical protein
MPAYDDGFFESFRSCLKSFRQAEEITLTDWYWGRW